MKSGVVSTSGMLTLRDSRTMTTDLRAQVGWSRSAGAGSGWAPRRRGRRMASRRSRASGPGHLCERAYGAPTGHGRCGRPGAGSGSRGGRSPAGDRPLGGRQGRDLRLSAPCPIRVQQGLPRARFHWSGPGGATPSGAVSAGSNPAGALVRGRNSNTLTILSRVGATPVTCGNAGLSQTWCPMRARDSAARSAGSPAQRQPAFTVSGPSSDGRPLLLPLCCSDAATADTVPWVARTGPQHSCARPDRRE
jgi:hypothetical protein